MSVAEKSRDFQAIMEQARAQNWTIKRTGRGHHIFMSPNGKDSVTAGGNYKDPHAIKNLVGRLRRYGFLHNK